MLWIIILLTGTDEAVILNVLGNHSNEQRIEIADAFKVAYGKVGEPASNVIVIGQHPSR